MRKTIIVIIGVTLYFASMGFTSAYIGHADPFCDEYPGAARGARNMAAIAWPVYWAVKGGAATYRLLNDVTYEPGKCDGGDE